MDLADVGMRLEEIRAEMIELLEEAEDLIRNKAVPGIVRARAESYWLAQIKVALMKEHGYLAGSMCDMEDTIEEIKEKAEDLPDDDDDEEEDPATSGK
jgi:hypothetical protein